MTAYGKPLFPDSLSHPASDSLYAYPVDEAWLFAWIQAIGERYHLNQQRLVAALKTETPIKGEPKSKRFKLASSLDNHWAGLIRFVDNPLIPMDNHSAEQPVSSNGKSGSRIVVMN